MPNEHPTIMNIGEHPTRQVRRTYFQDGQDFQETEISDISSVEIGQTTKGEAQIKSVKVYHSDAGEAADQAVAIYRNLVRDLAE